MELQQRERFYIENNECVNKVIPLRTKKQYNENNKEKISDYNKEYYQDNKDKKAEYDKQRNSEIFMCKCGKTLTLHHKSRHEKSIQHQNYIQEQNI